MAAEKFFIHCLANLRTPTKEGLRNCCVQYGILSEFNFHLQLRGEERLLYFRTEDRENEKSLVNLGPFAQKKWRLLEKQDLDKIAETIQDVAKFLKACSQGEMPHFAVISLFQFFALKKLFTISPQADNKWSYTICLSDAVSQRNVDFEDFILLTGILEPILTPNSAIKLEWTKQCAICGDFYQAKGTRAIYCSEKCRSRARAIQATK